MPPPEETPPPPPQRRQRWDPNARDSRPVPPDAPQIPTPLNDVPGDEGDVPPPPGPEGTRREPRNDSAILPSESRRMELQSLNQRAMDALVDGNVPDRMIRGRIRGNEPPLMAVIRGVLEEEADSVRRVGITDRLAKEIGARALGTLVARNDAGCVKSAIWLAEHFLAPQLVPFQQTVGGMAAPQVSDALQQTLVALGVPPTLAQQVMGQIEQNQATARRQQATQNLAADPELLERFSEGESLLPVVLDGDHDNEPIPLEELLPNPEPDDEGEDDDEQD